MLTGITRDCGIPPDLLLLLFGCSLNPALPSLEDEDGNPVQFRRTLLNKCQEEFERGVVAMKAVADREKRALTDTEVRYYKIIHECAFCSLCAAK